MTTEDEARIRGRGAESVDHVTRMELSNGLVVRSNERTPVYEMFREVFTSEIYSCEEVWPPAADSVVLDIGANIGLYSLMVARRWPDIVVHAFEPAPDSYATLVRNVAENGFDMRVQCHRAAVTDESGSVVLFRDRTSACDSLVAPQGEWCSRALDEVVVESIALDDLFSTFLDPERHVLVKIDAEGSEFDILSGASPGVLSRIDQLVLECHDYLYAEDRSSEIVGLLERHGFCVRRGAGVDNELLYAYRTQRP